MPAWVWRIKMREVRWRCCLIMNAVGLVRRNMPPKKGVRLESSHWITPRHQALVAAEVGRDTYDTRKFLNGRVSNLSVTWLHTPSNQQYFTLGTDFSRKSAQDSSDSYRRQGIRASWSRSWKRSGLGTTLTANMGSANTIPMIFLILFAKTKNILLRYRFGIKKCNCGALRHVW